MKKEVFIGFFDLFKETFNQYIFQFISVIFIFHKLKKFDVDFSVAEVLHKVVRQLFI